MHACICYSEGDRGRMRVLHIADGLERLSLVTFSFGVYERTNSMKNPGPTSLRCFQIVTPCKKIKSKRVNC